MKLKGKVALVTGGAKRIGREIALALAGRGCHVAITYLSSEREAAATVAAIRRKGVKGLAVAADQRDPDQARQAVRQACARMGRLDVLVNNASSFYPTPWARVTESQWEDLLATNLAGPWWFSQAAGRILKRQGAGKIINIADASAFSPWPSYLPYCAAKAGLVALTLGLAKALAPEVQVNAIAPGPILFPPGVTRRERRRAVAKTLLKRTGSPRDIAEAVLFLVEGTDFVTGAVLPVEGGRLIA